MIAVLPNLTSLLFYLILIHMLYLLIVLHIILHFLKNQCVLILRLVHSLSQLVVLIFQSKPFLLIIHVQKLFGQENSFFGHSLVLLEEHLVLLKEIEEPILPQFGLLR